MTYTQKGYEEVLNLSRAVMDSTIFKQQVYCSLRMGVGAAGSGRWDKKLIIFCGNHNSVIPNVKRIMFLALVPLLQGTVEQPASLFSYVSYK